MTEDRTYLLTPAHQRAGLQRGFTLIELMIGIAIVSMVLMFGIPGFSAWIQSSQIRNASESIESGLQLARAEAVRRNTQIQFVLTSVAGGGVATDWAVSCVAPFPTCPGAGLPSPLPTEIQKRSGSEGSANAQVTATQSTIVFSGMGRVTPTPLTNPIVLDITNPTGGNCTTASGPMRCLKILITSGGQSRMCDPALSLATNPRGCY